MIDGRKEPGRIDLRAIADDPRFAETADRVMTAVRSTTAGRVGAYEEDVFATLVRHSRALVTAAAVLIATSIAALALPSRTDRSAPQEVTLATWVRSNHVPTNAELLVAFEGY